jgi:Fe2+ or Zn2+ uptake regulation protein
MSEVSTPIDALEAAGYRITGPRRSVSELTSGRTGTFSAAELVADARQRRLRIGRATIFRALDLFVELGVVERLDLPTGEHAYIRCEPAHHHHLVCSRCGRAEEVDDAGLQEVNDAIARRTGFRIDTHRLELFGLCPACVESADD